MTALELVGRIDTLVEENTRRSFEVTYNATNTPCGRDWGHEPECPIEEEEWSEELPF